jgi:predicted lipoprotein
LALQTTVVSSTGGTPFTGTPLPSERQGDAGYLKLAIMANGASSCLQSGPPW